MNSENTRAYLAFALVGLMFVLVIALFFVDMPRETAIRSIRHWVLLLGL